MATNEINWPVCFFLQVLTYGILSAAVLRLIMVAVGVELIDSFQPILLLFAGILIYSSYKLITKEDEEDDEDLSNNGVVTFCRCSALDSSLLFLACMILGMDDS